jgi:mono/diheme cytochrome c family protein
VRAQTITPPPVPPSQKIGEAFRTFNEMCVQCHSAPGKEPTMVGKGLNPPPPKLSDAAQRWSRAELFWIVKNGIKMTGMPAFGPTHSDEELWLVVAFLQRLPNISPEEFKEMADKFDSKPGSGMDMKGMSPGHKM